MTELWNPNRATEQEEAALRAMLQDKRGLMWMMTACVADVKNKNWDGYDIIRFYNTLESVAEVCGIPVERLMKAIADARSEHPQ